MKNKKNNLLSAAGHLAYRRTPIEIESPEQLGYENIRYNLTESSVPDVVLSQLDLNLKDMVLCYTDHMGKPGLRQRISAEGEGLNPQHVMITTGAVAALFIIATSLLKAGSHMVVLHPNYVANIETPRAIGCQVDYLRLSFEEKFSLDLKKMEKLIKPDTRLVSLTYPHNPTGTVLSEDELQDVVSLVESKGCYLVFDETYRDMAFGSPLPMAASLSPNVISVSSFSKSYGLPGIRIGWLISKDKNLMETFLAAKEQIFICNSVVDEEIADRYLAKKEQLFPKIQSHIQTNFEMVKAWMEKEQHLQWIEPKGGCVGFPRFHPDIDIDIDNFYRILNEDFKTYVGPGHWFEMDRRFMRIGYAWPNKQEVSGGLDAISEAIKKTVP